MTIGRANSAASETRSSVSWKVECVPNSGRNCFGRTSREAGHSRVPAPPHMIRGMIRLVIKSDPMVIAVPLREARDAVLDRRRGLEADVALEIGDVGIGRFDVARLHRQHLLDRGPPEFLLEQRYHVSKLFGVIVTDIVNRP